MVLSVVIACLNAADTLGRQLDALAGQPCPVPWELLVCDNGSTDGTALVVSERLGRLPGLRLVDASEVRGAGAARNRGAQEARGRWLAFCDADDEVAGDWLAEMCAALAEHRFVAGSFESRRLNDARVLRSRPLDQQSGLQASDIGARLPHAGGGNMGVHRADFLAVGGFDPGMPWLEDTDFSWRAQLAGVPLVFRPGLVVHVRLRQTYRSMFEQGRHYGMAHAVLEQRYGRPSPDVDDVRAAAQAAQAASVAAAVVRGEHSPPAGAALAPGRASAWVSGRGRALSRRAAHAGTWFVDHVIAGRLAWRAGWVVGHRSRRAREAATRASGTPAGARAGTVSGNVRP